MEIEVPGFAGTDHHLYYMDKTLMLFGDARAFVTETSKELPAKGGALRTRRANPPA